MACRPRVCTSHLNKCTVCYACLDRSLGYCKPKRHPRSVIKHKCEVQTRGRQATACFFFIVKSDILIFVWSVAKTTIYISSVGATIGRPRSLRLQNAHPSIAKTNDIHLSGRGRRPNVCRRQTCIVRNANVVDMTRGNFGYKLRIRLLPKSVIYVSLPQWGSMSQATVEFASQTSRGPLAVDEVFVT